MKRCWRVRQREEFMRRLVEFDHFVVSGEVWNRDGLKYRRHRLCEHLLRQPETALVFYIAPFGWNLKKPLASYREFRRLTRKLENGVQQLAIPDYQHWIRYGSSVSCHFLRRVTRLISKERQSILWFTNPSFPGLCRHAWDRIVYDCSDLWNREGTSARKLMAERVICGKSDKIFATTEFLKHRVAALGGPPADVVENGVDYAQFRKAEPLQWSQIPRPRLGFVGGLKFKIDFDLIGRVADKFPKASLVLIGPLDESQKAATAALRSRGNVYFPGPVAYHEVAAHTRALDVGLLPYRNMEYNRAVSPLKLFEYLAAGLPAVGTGIPTTQKYQREGIYYYSESNHDQFVADCQRAIEVADHPRYREERCAVASQHDWGEKFRYMIQSVIPAEKE